MHFVQNCTCNLLVLKRLFDLLFNDCSKQMYVLTLIGLTVGFAA